MPAMEPMLGARINDDRKGDFIDFIKSISVNGEHITVTEKEEGYVCWYIPGINLPPEKEFAEVGGTRMSFEQMGVINQQVQDMAGSSAYHVHEGSLTLYDPTHAYSDSGRPQVSTLDVAPFILDYFDVAVPGYMRRPGPIHLN